MWGAPGKVLGFSDEKDMARAGWGTISTSKLKREKGGITSLETHPVHS